MNAEAMKSDAGLRADAARTLETRRSVSAGLLGEPGPDAHALRRMLAIAARVPDHGGLVPWRFVIVESDARKALATRLGEACMAAAEDNDAAREQAQKTTQKIDRLFGQPPLVVVVVSRPDRTASIPVWEQTLSAGAACMNLMNAAAALGYSANWLSGWVAAHPAARPVLGLGDGETIAGIIPIGTPTELVPDRPRPDLSKIVSVWVG